MKRLSAALLTFLCITPPALFAGTDFLLVDANPLYYSSGKCADLLESDAAISRTFSSAYSLRNRPELSFYNSVLPNTDASLQTVAFGWHKHFLRYLRTAVYFSYLNLGDFRPLDELSRAGDALENTDLYIGAPLIFDFRELHRITVVKSESGEDNSNNVVGPNILEQITGSLNLNYYQSTLGGEDARTFFADYNSVIRLPLPYIGMPPRLVSSSETEEIFNKKRARLLKRFSGVTTAPSPAGTGDHTTNTTNTSAHAPAPDEGGSGALAGGLGGLGFGELSRALRELNEEHEQQKSLVSRVEAVRREIYKIYDYYDVELHEQDISNFVSSAIQEIGENVQRFEFEIHKNRGAVLGWIRNSIATNRNQIKTQEALLLSNLSSGMQVVYYQAVATNYEMHLTNYHSWDQEGLRARYLETARAYKTGRRDTWQSIAKKQYGDQGLALQLQKFNNWPTDTKLKRNKTIMLPDKAYFDEIARFEKAERLEDLVRQGYMEYTVKRGDTWSRLAALFLLDSERSVEIREYNKKKKNAEPVPGEVIRIPVTRYQEEILAKEQAFKNKTIILEKQLMTTGLTPLALRLYTTISGRYAELIRLYKLAADVRSEAYRKQTDIINLQNLQVRKLKKMQTDLIKELEKLKLKKKYDILNANNKDGEFEALKLYKERERQLFKSMLQTIFDSKIVILNQLKRELVNRQKYEERFLRDYFSMRQEALDTRANLAIADAGSDKERITAIKTKLKSDRDYLASELSHNQARMRKGYGEERAALMREQHITELIYIGSKNQVETFAAGISVKNIGVPVSYLGVRERLPLSPGLDLNYNILRVPNHSLTLYNHFGYNRLEGFTAGLGSAYRFLKILEVRVAGIYENQSLSFATSVSLLLNIGLLNYRLDTGIHIMNGFGTKMQLGLQVVF
jgi:hypothetical protein